MYSGSDLTKRICTIQYLEFEHEICHLSTPVLQVPIDFGNAAYHCSGNGKSA